MTAVMIKVLRFHLIRMQSIVMTVSNPADGRFATPFYPCLIVERIVSLFPENARDIFTNHGLFTICSHFSFLV